MCRSSSDIMVKTAGGAEMNSHLSLASREDDCLLP